MSLLVIIAIILIIIIIALAIALYFYYSRKTVIPAATTSSSGGGGGGSKDPIDKDQLIEYRLNLIRKVLTYNDDDDNYPFPLGHNLTLSNFKRSGKDFKEYINDIFKNIIPVDRLKETKLGAADVLEGLDEDDIDNVDKANWGEEAYVYAVWFEDNKGKDVEKFRDKQQEFKEIDNHFSGREIELEGKKVKIYDGIVEYYQREYQNNKARQKQIAEEQLTALHQDINDPYNKRLTELFIYTLIGIAQNFIEQNKYKDPVQQIVQDNDRNLFGKYLTTELIHYFHALNAVAIYTIPGLDMTEELKNDPQAYKMILNSSLGDTLREVLATT